MSESLDGDIQGELFAFGGNDAFAGIAIIVSGERAEKAIPAHDGDKIALIKGTFQLNIVRVQVAFSKRTG
jgi:hypothetical protein